MRLKNGNASYKGRLEIRYNEEWGTVCNKNFKNETGTVACKELGFDGFITSENPANPGPLGGRIWLENVQCNGNEQSIFDCTHSGWGNITDCTHEDDVVISCTSM